ncbi:hypothetical protein CH063_08187 [Colletotrichum higginsianum]|uniref:Uncharacterized protein n=1 Tax=Colletotrichum higginsianum (strain IMI 349063) TaxID=759273 RepID=H1V8X2_COLHI|nr:hypothetical protein CH063_08187 [Colletotrichum higginsianum]
MIKDEEAETATAGADAAHDSRFCSRRGPVPEPSHGPFSGPGAWIRVESSLSGQSGLPGQRE